MVEMLRNLAQTAAAASDNYLVAIRLLLVFLMCSSLIMPHWSVNANELKHRICPKTLWRIDFNNSFRQGEATLKFDIPYQDKVCTCVCVCVCIRAFLNIQKCVCVCVCVYVCLRLGVIN